MTSRVETICTLREGVGLPPGPSEVDRTRQLARIGLEASATMHDLNNMLQIAICSFSRLTGSASDDRAALHLQRVGTALQRCAQLTQRSRVGRRQPDRMRLSGVLREMVDVLQLASGSGITLRIALPDEALVVSADRVALESALLNLVINARDAMRGRGRIDVACSSDQARLVVLSVEDTGPGFPPTLQDRLGERLLTTKPNGSGHGLANVREFVEACGGSLLFRTGPGAWVGMILPVE